MRLIFFICVAISTSTLCSSQIVRRTLLAGGNLTGSFSNRKNFRQAQLKPNPLLGFFINNNLCLGLSFPFEYTYTHYRDKPPVVLLFGNPNNLSRLSENKSVRWSASPFIRGYFGKKSLQLFTQREVSVGRRIVKNVYTDRLTGSPRLTEKNTDVGVGAGAGINYRINRQLGAEVLLSYQWQSEPLSTDRLINTGSTIGIRLGLVALLSKP